MHNFDKKKKIIIIILFIYLLTLKGTWRKDKRPNNFKLIKNMASSINYFLLAQILYLACAT